jgi:hypothetical protein
VGAVAHIASPAGTLTAPASEVIGGFIAPAGRDRAAGVNTQVAIASTATPLTLTFTLRDLRGAEVAGGRTETQLGANAVMLQTIDALFPKADTNGFEGTLSVRSEGGTFAANVTQTSAGARAVTTVPVVILRD